MRYWQVVFIIIVMAASCRNEDTYNSHMELTQRYLDELQYEQAIAEYRAAIEIEPNNVEAYLALAELYVDMGDYEAAVNVLDQGIEQTDSRELADYLEEVQEIYHAVTEAQGEPDARELEVPVAEEDVREPWEEVVYVEDGSYSIYEYDAGGNRIKSTYYNADGTIWSIHEYDAAGNPIKHTDY